LNSNLKIECGDANCSTCSGEGTGKCTECDAGYGVGSDGTCVTCEDANCESCSDVGTGKCLACSIGYTVSNGVCGALSGNVVVQISSTLRYEMTLDDYNSKGGDSYFILETSKALGIDASQITITSVKEGSVILTFTITSSESGSSLADQETQLKLVKSKLDEAVKSGAMDVYSGATILNYESGVLVVSKLYFCEVFVKLLKL